MNERKPIVDTRLFVAFKKCDWLVPVGEQCEICGEVHEDESRPVEVESLLP